MRLRGLVWREIFERRAQLATSFLAILLGITVIVAVKDITFYSEKAVAGQLDALGANVLVLPSQPRSRTTTAPTFRTRSFPRSTWIGWCCPTFRGSTTCPPSCRSR